MTINYNKNLTELLSGVHTPLNNIYHNIVSIIVPEQFLKCHNFLFLIGI